MTVLHRPCPGALYDTTWEPDGLGECSNCGQSSAQHVTYVSAEAEGVAYPLIVAGESVSQQITRLLGTDDWTILHSGHQMVTDEDLDAIESRA